MTVVTTVKSIALAACLALSAVAASASTITLDRQGSNNFNGYGSAAVDLVLSSHDLEKRVWLGTFALTGDLHGSGVQDIAAWTLDILNVRRFPSDYIATTNPYEENHLSDVQKHNIRALFNTGYNAAWIKWRNFSVGFHLALLEIVYETGDVLNVDDGAFKATNQDGARAVANRLLANLGNQVAPQYKVIFLDPADTDRMADRNRVQSLVTIAAVPLPAAGLLLIGALGGLGLMARRRRKTA